jgi:hypothetical protein
MSGSARKLARRSDRAPTRMVLVYSFAQLARMAGVNRSTIGRAFRPGGPLHPALIGKDSGDGGHPAVVANLAEHTGHRAVVVDELPSAVSFKKYARLSGRKVDEVRAACAPGGALHDAWIPPHHLSAVTFSVVSGSPLADVIEATRGGRLTPAVTKNGLIDLGSEAALEYCAQRPFRRLPNGDADESDMPQGMLAPACIGEDDIDLSNPFARAFSARCLGRVQTEAEIVAEHAASVAGRSS